MVRSLWDGFFDVVGATTNVFSTAGRELQQVTTQAHTVFQNTTAELEQHAHQCLKNVGDWLQNVETQLSKGQLESHVLEQFGEALAHGVFSENNCPSTEDFLKAIEIVLPQYQKNMSTITTDVKVSLARCFTYATTEFETKTDSSSPAHNPTKNQLEQTNTANMLHNITCGALGGGVAGTFAGGPGGAAAGAAIGALVGAVKAFGNNLLNDVLREAKEQRINRTSQPHPTNVTPSSITTTAS